MRTVCCFFLFVCVVLSLNIACIIFISYFTKMRIGRWYIFHKSFPKAWIWMSYLSKNMKCKSGKSYKLFYFQGRESSNMNEPKVMDSPSKFRLPSLHPTPFLGDTMNSMARRSSEHWGNEWAWHGYYLVAILLPSMAIDTPTNAKYTQQIQTKTKQCACVLLTSQSHMYHDYTNLTRL